jgi:beta-lactamase class A
VGALLQAPQDQPPGTVRPWRDEALTQKLGLAIAGFHGDVGLYVRHLTTGRTAAFSADELFPTASMIKVPILVGLFDRIEHGELDYHKPLAYDESRRYDEGEDLLASFKHGEKISPRKLATLMIAFSDNTASLWCQELAGTGTAINRWLAEHGFERTRVNSRTAGREDDRRKFGWGQTTPREMAELLVRIRAGRAVGLAASEEMYRMLGRSYWDGESLSQIPPTVHCASKQGAVNRSRSEVVLVHAPSGDYVFCVITKNQQDQSWGRDNEGFVLLRRVSRLLWEHFEPGSTWKPAESQTWGSRY